MSLEKYECEFVQSQVFLINMTRVVAVILLLNLTVLSVRSFAYGDDDASQSRKVHLFCR